MAIPKILHQTWKTKNIPIHFQDWQQSCKQLHPHWQYRLWTDADNRLFIETHFPWFLATYDQYPTNIMRVDAVRYFILLYHGGVFLDLDYECLSCLDSLIADQRFVIGLEPDIHAQLPQALVRGINRILCPTVMASEIGHPFLRQVCSALISTADHPGVLDATGPFLLSRLYEESPRQADIRLISPKHLYPLTKNQSWEGKVYTAKEELQGEAVYGVHHWHGTWWKESNVQAAKSGTTDRQLVLTFYTAVGGNVISMTRLECERAHQLLLSSQQPPRVCCVFRATGELDVDLRAVAAYQRQSYKSRRLLICDNSKSLELSSHLKDIADDSIHHHRQPGHPFYSQELIELTADLAQSDYVCYWHSSHLHDPQRLEQQILAMLTSGADACFLQSMIIWAPETRKLGCSANGAWHDSLLCKTELLHSQIDFFGDLDVKAPHTLSAFKLALLDQPSLLIQLLSDDLATNSYPSSDPRQPYKDYNANSDQKSNIHKPKIIKHYSDRQYLPILDHLSQHLPVAEVAAAANSRHLAAPNTSHEPEHKAAKNADQDLPFIQILTPVKDASTHLATFGHLLSTLDYPTEKLSLAFIEGDSRDKSLQDLHHFTHTWRQHFSEISIHKKDYGFTFAGDRWRREIQLQRRSVLAKARNQLLRHIRDETDWVVWIDVDMISMPPDILRTLVSQGDDMQILTPHCVTKAEGVTYDLNAYQICDESITDNAMLHTVDGLLQPPRGQGRRYMEQLRSHDRVLLDSVGCTVLAVQAELHRNGLIFPAHPYMGLIESEAMALMARQLGVNCWGLPKLEVLHASQ